MDELVQAQLALNAVDLSDRPGFDEQFLGVRVGIPPLDGVESVLLPTHTFPFSCGWTSAWPPLLRSEWTAPS